MFKLRPYQDKARILLNRAVSDKINPVYVCPTGGGKTITAIHFIADQIKMNKTVFVLTPQIEIFNQWFNSAMELSPGYITSEGIKGVNRKLYICMPMSLKNILHYVPESMAPNIIITDECHHSAADTWKSIYNFYPKAINTGLTATPERTDGKGIDDIYTSIIQTATMKQLINEDSLSIPLTIIPKEYHLQIPMKDNGEFDEKAQEIILSDKRIIGDAIKYYEQIFKGLPVLVACATHKHAEIMTEKFNNAGWQWGHIHSKLIPEVRADMLRRIINRELNGLCTVGIGIEGMDIPGLFGLIWLRKTTSLTIYLQLLGRILRKMEGKKYGISVDLVGNVFLHGLPEMNRELSLMGRNNNDCSDVKMKMCKCCKVLNSIENEFCHFCGNDLNIDFGNKPIHKSCIPEMVDGELVLLNRDGDLIELRNELDEIKEKHKMIVEEKKQKENIPIEDAQKVQILRDVLFKNNSLILHDVLKKYK